MLERINRFYLTLHCILIVLISTIVLLTKYNDHFRNLLFIVSAEGGLFEWGSFFIAFTLSGFALLVYFHSRRHKIFSRRRRKFILVIAIMAYLLAMEEISWGQHIFGFESVSFFEQNNMQNETNLHNLVSAELLNLALHTFIYLMFIIIPLIIYFKPSIATYSASIRGKTTIYLPSLHNVLMFCFASGLQAYFLPKTMVDTIVLWACLLMMFILIICKPKYRSPLLIIHFTMVLLAVVVFVFSYDVFAYNNMQYEIREFIISYAFLYWFYNWTTNLKNKVALQLK